MSKSGEIYQIKVTPRGSLPNIWRRMQVKSDITLAKLHGILECIMGWEDKHLHQFMIQGQRCGVPDEDRIHSRETKDERKGKLWEIVAAANGQLVYHYDFADDGYLTRVVERTLAPEKRVRYPVCLGAPAQVLGKTWEACLVTRIFSKRSETPNIRNMTNCSNGSAEASIPRHLTWIR